MSSPSSAFTVSSDHVLQALRSVAAPGGGGDVVGAGMISGVVVRGGRAGFMLTLSSSQVSARAALERECDAAVRRVRGIEEVSILVTAEKTLPPAPEPVRKAQWNREPIAGVKRILAVASGKGGVGKSTTSVNLAYAFAGLGLRVGVLDADIYGPSVPRMMGISGQPDVAEGKIVPKTAHHVAAMSMGLLVDEASAMVWRGPQLAKALQQLLRGVTWGELDVLVVDLPPGTGDVHLSLAQMVPVDAAIIVTTPQEVAVADARKCVDLFRKVAIPVLGVVENMSGFTDESGQHHAIFGAGGGARLAVEAGVAQLAQIPIDMAIGIDADAGRLYGDPQGYYHKLAETVKSSLTL